jgi:membrane fusion protein (multidrug efflux system)
MKKLFLMITATLLLVACNQSELDKKKKELATAKGDLKELTAKIATLEKEIAKLDTTVKAEAKAKLIKVDTIEATEFKHFIEVQGNVEAEENVTVLPQQPGLVTAIYVKEGDRVSKGQVLGITETSKTMEAGIQALQIQLDLATTAFEKQERLWKQNIGSEIQYLQAKTQKEALEKQISMQRTQIEMTKLISPIAGVVDDVNLKVGDMAIGSQAMPGIRIINNNKLSVKGKLSDSDFGKVKEGDKVEIEFNGINKSTSATITHIQKTIDARSRTFSVEAKLNNGANEYAANMLAKMKINDATLKNVIVVPSNIVQNSAEGLYVLVAADENGHMVAARRTVVPGMEYQGLTVITEGLQPGDKIITFGYSEIVNGQRIQF